jgi:hypothetical protein
MIDGKEHPEQIPDLTAYRLHLLLVSRPATPADPLNKTQAAYLGRIKLSDRDTQAVIPVLADFHERYQKLIADFNAIAEAANNQGRDVDSAERLDFLTQRDLLVQNTRDTLRTALSTQGWTQWDSHVQREKSHMRIPVEEGVK